MSANTGGPAFPTPEIEVQLHDDNGNVIGCRVFPPSQGMTLLDWYAGQEAIGDEDLSAGICDHFAGPRPSGDWKTNPVGWYEWEARWRAGVKYTRASAMLAEKARREAVVQESLTTQDDGRIAELQAANRELVEALQTCLETLERWSPMTCQEARDNLAKHKGVA